MFHRKLFLALLLAALFLTLNPTVSKAVETGQDVILGPYDLSRDLVMSGNNYAFTFYKSSEGKAYVNINGKDYGPYDDIIEKSSTISDTHWGFGFEKGVKKYANIDGKEYGPYDYVGAPQVSDTNGGFRYMRDGGWYVNINGKEYGPYNNVDLQVSGTKWGFQFIREEKHYVNINGKEYGPYNQISSDKGGLEVGTLQVSDTNWGFVFYRDGNLYVNINGKEYGPYDEYSINNLQVPSVSWGFGFRRGVTGFEPGKNYVNINGQEYGPFDFAYPILSDTGWGFFFERDGNMYVNVNGKEFGPYPSIEIVGASMKISNTNWGFGFSRDGKGHVNINGKEKEELGALYPQLSDTNWGFAFSRDGKKYININDKEYGPYDDVEDPKISDTSWAFHFERGGESYVNINGTEHGPYDSYGVNNVQVSYTSSGFRFRRDGLDYVFIHKFLTSNTNTSFSDVPTSHQYYDAIEYVKNAGIVQGYTDGTYKPENPINRAEFTKIIMSAINSSIPDGSNCFSDVKSEWYAKYVCLAKVNGIIKGYDDGKFRPSNNIQFSEAAKIIVKAFGINVTETPTWYEAYVNVLREKNAIPPSVGTKWDKIVTRGEMAYMIYKMKTATQSTGTNTTVDVVPIISSIDPNQGIIGQERYITFVGIDLQGVTNISVEGAELVGELEYIKNGDYVVSIRGKYSILNTEPGKKKVSVFYRDANKVVRKSEFRDGFTVFKKEDISVPKWLDILGIKSWADYSDISNLSLGILVQNLNYTDQYSPLLFKDNTITDDYCGPKAGDELWKKTWQYMGLDNLTASLEKYEGMAELSAAFIRMMTDYNDENVAKFLVLFLREINVQNDDSLEKVFTQYLVAFKSKETIDYIYTIKDGLEFYYNIYTQIAFSDSLSETQKIEIQEKIGNFLLKLCPNPFIENSLKTIWASLNSQRKCATYVTEYNKTKDENYDMSLRINTYLLAFNARKDILYPSVEYPNHYSDILDQCIALVADYTNPASKDLTVGDYVNRNVSNFLQLKFGDDVKRDYYDKFLFELKNNACSLPTYSYTYQSVLDTYNSYTNYYEKIDLVKNFRFPSAWHKPSDFDITASRDSAIDEYVKKLQGISLAPKVSGLDSFLNSKNTEQLRSAYLFAGLTADDQQQLYNYLRLIWGDPPKQ